jgi:hypothetical protein
MVGSVSSFGLMGAESTDLRWWIYWAHEAADIPWCVYLVLWVLGRLSFKEYFCLCESPAELLDKG